MTPISTRKQATKCNGNGAHLLSCMHDAETSVCACDSPSVCTPPTTQLRQRTGKIGVYTLGQSLREQPRLHVSRTVAAMYVAGGVARKVNRGQAIQFVRSHPCFTHRDRSAQMGPKVIEQAAMGQHKELVAAWKPTKTPTGGNEHAQDSQPTTDARRFSDDAAAA